MTATLPMILIVDDEERLRTLLHSYLVQEGFRVLLAGDGLHALDLIRAEQPDLIVLDLMLPGLDGLEVCRRLRTFSDAYVLMLTAKAEEIDRVIGLEVGADNYLTKPFSPRELVARIRAMLRRPRSSPETSGAQQPLHFGPLTIDHARHEVTLAGMPLGLTNLEYDLLTTLASAPGRTFTRAQLLDRVWGTDYFGDDHVVDVHEAMRAEILHTLARRCFAEQDRLRGGPAEELCAPGYAAHLPGVPPLDLARHQGFAAAFYAAFPNLRHEIELVVADGDRVAVRFRLYGTHTRARSSPSRRPVSRWWSRQRRFCASPMGRLPSCGPSSTSLGC